MRLVKLRLQHIKAFETLDLGFTNDGVKPRPWTLLLGDNASGKTTILRCLAIGINDESSAAGLVREMKGSLVRKTRGKRSEGMILVGLVDSRGQPWTLKTILTPLAKTGDRVRQRAYKLAVDKVPDGPFPDRAEKGFVPIEKFPWRQTFVCGYGAGRSIDGREEYTDYRTIDAVYTLFRYDQPLQSPELAWRRYRQRVVEGRSKRTSERVSIASADRQISEILGTVLDMTRGKGPILLEEGIHLRYGNRTVALADHADGYRSVTTWLLDFIAWYLLYRKGIQVHRIGGVVLIDEIEQHLHPRWQRYLIGKLRKQFSKVQFIATTHSPLCAASAADLTADECSLTRLSFDPKQQRIVASAVSLPYGERADQMLMSSAFGLIDTRNPKIGDRLAEFRRLFRKPRPSPFDQRKMRRLAQAVKIASPDLLQFQEEAHVELNLRRLIAESRRMRGSH
jgi:energy-coupling factor transporter ATP-binding protein EcfA2